MATKRMFRRAQGLAAMVVFIATAAHSFANDGIIVRPAEDARAASQALSQQATATTAVLPASHAIPITVLSGSAYAMRQFEETVWNGLNAQLAKYGCGTSIERSLDRAELEIILDYLEDSERLRDRAELDPAFVLAMFKSVPNSCQYGHDAVGNFILSLQIGSPQPTLASMHTPSGSDIEINPVPLGDRGANTYSPSSGTNRTGGVKVVPLDLRGIYY